MFVLCNSGELFQPSNAPVMLNDLLGDEPIAVALQGGLGAPGGGGLRRHSPVRMPP